MSLERYQFNHSRPRLFAAFNKAFNKVGREKQTHLICCRLKRVLKHFIAPSKVRPSKRQTSLGACLVETQNGEAKSGRAQLSLFVCSRSRDTIVSHSNSLLTSSGQLPLGRAQCVLLSLSPPSFPRLPNRLWGNANGHQKEIRH